ncbi:MAG: VCBS repeat-containing protein, partial [Candidatus Omnitrophica bacterium]|nr:VCBS repeat-containing protein [Candidatus Omnitrophota bacterium]
MKKLLLIGLIVFSFAGFNGYAEGRSVNKSDSNTNVKQEEKSIPLEEMTNEGDGNSNVNNKDTSKPAEETGQDQRPLENPQQPSTENPAIPFPYIRNASVNVDPHTGSANMSFPLEVVQGRGGIQPSISLNYNSSMKNGILGVGWDLSLGYIQRSTKNGPPKYNDTDRFVLNQSGSSQELVRDGTNNRYYPEIEGAFMKIEQVTDGWLVTDKNGIKYYFGQSSATQEYHPSYPDKIFRWFLDRVEDLNGNYMTISYILNGNKLYPNMINFTGNTDGLAPFSQVKFNYSDRNDKSFSYISKFKISINNKLDNIEVYANGVVQRKYVIGYTPSQSTQKLLVTSITQYGLGGTGEPLPSVTFRYTDTELKGFEQVSASGVPADAKFVWCENGYLDLGTRITDLNADGYDDIYRSFYRGSDYEGTRIEKIWVNNKDNTWSEQPGFVPPRSGDHHMILIDHMGPSYVSDSGYRMADINGDGRIDFLRYIRGDASCGYGVVDVAMLHNQADNWLVDPNWAMPLYVNSLIERQYCPQSYSAYLGTMLADVNADGFTDILVSKEGHKQDHVTLLNNLRNGSGNTGWSNDSFFSHPPDTEYTDLSYGATLVDLNGDGLPEFFYMRGATRKVYINNGSGWMEDGASPWLNTLGYGDLTDNSTQFNDINGDGLADLLYAKNYNRVLINTGNGWVLDRGWDMPGGHFDQLAKRTLEANGDGMTDLMDSYHDNPHNLWLNKGKPADMLTSVNNGIGGVTTVEYDVSTKPEFENTFLPFPIRVVKNVTVSNSLGDSYNSSYEYKQGLWDVNKREFRGFGEV